MKNKSNTDWLLEIDFSDLMDLRIDYAFKLIFGLGNTIFLISLLNAIFANKKIPRKIKTLTIMNPYLDKYSKDDKLSVLDIRAKLDDGSTVLIEMHLYGIDNLKYKTIRSWARAYSEELKEGEGYSTQQPVICVAFTNGSVDGNESSDFHKCCKIMDISDKTIFTNALELHYIDMSAFVKDIQKTNKIPKDETQGSILANWLAFINQKDISNKELLKSICKEQEEIGMAVSVLSRTSKDKLTRQEYLRRQDDIILANIQAQKYEAMERELVEKLATIAENEAIIAKNEAALAKNEAALAKNEAALATKDAALATKDAALADLEKTIAELKSRLGEK